MECGGRSAGRGAGCALLCLAAWLGAGTAQAYSSHADYVLPVQEGGGGGRFFTGTPADGYGCEMCHEGATGAPLTIAGLPQDGYEPGLSYEVTFTWDASAPHVALIAEMTDRDGLPAGTVALPPYATWGPEQLCEEGGFPAADVCTLHPTEGVCCREVDPMRDACSFPGERSALWVPDCASRAARMVWTAPIDGRDVWLGVGMVTSNLENDALGDGVTAVRRLLRPRGVATELSLVDGGCSTQPGSVRVTPPALLALLWLMAWVTRRVAGASRVREGDE